MTSPSRDVLLELGLTSVVKTSGSKGYHIAVLLDGTATLRDVARFAHGVGRLLVRRYPDRLTQEFSKVDRAGRIYMDTDRNHPPATFAAVYAVRARPGAPVSAPCTWDEVAAGVIGPRSLTLRNMAQRVSAVGDLWSAAAAVSLQEPLQRLEKLST
jgi:bifunctional non-homologous end joining protein LigD